MKHLLVLFLFISTSSIAQKTALKVTINSITFEDTKPSKRNYFIKYQIENTTKNEVSFFLIPQTLIAHTASSMTLYSVYKLYRNGVLETMDGPFMESPIPELNEYDDFEDKKSPEAKAFVEKINKKYRDENKLTLENYKKKGGQSKDEKFILDNNELVKSKITLQPCETKYFEIKTNWDKNRYIKNDDFEFYLDEKDKFEFELNLILNKTNRKDRLLQVDFEKFLNDPNFLEGTFVSNKVAIFF